MLYIILTVLIYLAITTYLGYLGYRQTKTANDYLVAGRQIHPLVMALSYGATFISTSAIVGFGGAAGSLGMGLLWLTFLNIFVGIFIAFILFGKRTRKMGHNLDAHTFPELLGTRFQSKFIQGFSAFVIFLFMPVYAAAVVKGGADFIQSYFSIPFEVSLLFFVAIVSIYVWMGGMKGVMYTDAFQGAIMFFGMLFLLIYVYNMLGGVTAAHEKLTALFAEPAAQEQAAGLIKGGFQGWSAMPAFGSPIWWSLVSTIIMGVGIGVLAQPQLVVRFMTVKSNRELNRAVVSGGVFIFMMTGVAFLVGALSNVAFFSDTGSISVVAAGSTDKIIPQFIKTYLPDWYGAIFMVTLLAAAMSTLSSQFHTIGSAAGRDLYEKTMGRSAGSILVIRTAIFIGIVLTTVLAWLSKYLDSGMAVIATGTALFFGLCAATFLPAYICALFFRGVSTAAVKAGMLSGFTTAIIWIFFVHEKESSSLQLCLSLTGKTSIVKDTALAQLAMVDPIFIALPVSILVTFLTAQFTKGALEQKHIDKCFSGIK